MKLPKEIDIASSDLADGISLASLDENNVALLVRYTFRAFTRRLQMLVGKFGLTSAEFRVLRTIESGGALTQMQIARLAGMDRPYTTLVAKQLREKGLTTTSHDPRDGRRVLMALSPRGAEVTATISGELDAVNRHAVAGISADDLGTFRTVIAALRENLDHLGVDASRDD